MTIEIGFTEKPDSLEGGCLCGKVRYRSTAQPNTTVHCYFTDCRRLGRTGHATHTVIPKNAFHLISDVKEYRRAADSGNQINRRFCPHCGSALFHTREGLDGMVVIRTSSLDNPELCKPNRVIYTSSAVSWDHIDPNLPSSDKMTKK